MFTFFTDRDGKYQLLALAESAFDPLSRTTRFMLTEEAHHMFVGETGVLRIIQRTCEQMKANPGKDPRELGLIDLPTIQKALNFWYSISSTCSAAKSPATPPATSLQASRAARRKRSTRITSASSRSTTWTRSKTARSAAKRCPCATP
ncbi:MAG: hypothetical protein R3B07_28665 [Polyangiaceae bacterium]